MTMFSDLSFIFRFLPVMLLVFYVTPHRFRTFTLLVGSVFFYALTDFKFLAVLLVAVVINGVLAEGCFRKERTFLIVSVVFDVALLVLFKILGRAIGAAAFPVGISFYTFRMISYQIDLFRSGETKRPNMVQTVTYYTMFPQILQGPIMRYADMLRCKAIAHESWEEKLESIEEGVRYFAAGLFFKVMLADRLSMGFDEISRIGYESISTPLSWVGVVMYSLNLYYDFWGYSLMAAGLGVMFGFPFIENFHHPYAAKGVAEYYRRWHMTLGAFFKDYVYIPLGGSRGTAHQTVRNLFIVWLLTGFWHGATFNFLLWGMLLCLLILSERYLLVRLPLRLEDILKRVHVLLFVPLTWMVFKLTGAQMLSAYFLRLFPFRGTPAIVNASDYVSVLKDYAHVLIPGLLFLIPAVYDTLMARRKSVAVTVILFAGFWISVYHAANATGNPFMYINF